MPRKIVSKKAYKHRRQKLGFWQIMSYVGFLFGNLLYYIGSEVEREAKKLKRKTRNALRRFFPAFGRFILNAFTTVLHAVKSLMVDIFSPLATLISTPFKLAKIKKGCSEKEYPERKSEFLSKLKASRHTRISRCANICAPILSAAVLGLVVFYIMNINFVLELNVNDQTVGYVYNESNYNNAKRLLQSRMVSVEGSEWNDNAVYRIAIVPDERVTETYALADNILKASGEDITEGTGVFVGGVFLGCTTESDDIHEKIDATLAVYESYTANNSNAVVRFKHNVELIDGIFPTETLRDYSYFEELIDSGERGDLVYTFAAGDSIEQIAANNGMSLSQLRAMNPNIDFENINSGTKLMVARNEQLFAVRTLVVETYTETIAYSTLVIPNVNYEVGYVQVVTRGSLGVNEVTVEIEYQNGREISRTIVNTVTKSEAVNEQIIVGTRPAEGTDISAIGTGYLSAPITNFMYIYRGWISGVHRGIDFTAARGSVVYAADNGMVSFAGWHGVGNGGFGNYVAIDHNNSMVTHYAHLDRYVVSTGDIVSKGQVIGFVGSTGNSTGYHLHFAITINGSWTPSEPYLYHGAHM